MTVAVMSESEWFRAADAWQPGDPFPLVAGPQLERYRSRLAARGIGSLPAVQARVWPGWVVSFGADRSRAVGALLARASGRPHRHVPVEAVTGVVEECGSALVALVAHLDDLDAAGDWLLSAESRAGVVTARGTAALVTLVYRTLTAPAVATGEPVTRRLIHPTMSGASAADVTGFDEMPALTDGRAELLLLRTHGRECCLHLPDGVICGRATAPGERPEPVGAGLRAPSCMKGAGCYRTDIPQSSRIPAHDLTGDVVFTHSCSPIAVGVNAMPHDVNVALGLLDGTTVAVLGAVGRHMADPRASEVLLAAVRRGERLGDILRELNDLGAGEMGERSRFGLLGDPAFTPAPAATEPSGDAGPGSAAAPAPGGSDPVLRRLADDVLPALTRLTWLDVPLGLEHLVGLGDAVRAAWDRRMAGAAGVPAAAEAAVSCATAVQRDMIERYVHTIHTTWWQFASSELGAMHQSGWRPASCAHCGRTSARAVRYRSGLAPSVELTVDLCRRCGLTRWQVGEALLDQAADMDVPMLAGETVTLSLRLHNTSSRPLTVAAGLAFVNGGYHRLPEPVTWTAELDPGERRTLHARPEVRGPHPNPDMFEAVFVTCADGNLTVLPVSVSVDNDPPADLPPAMREWLVQEVNR